MRRILVLLILIGTGCSDKSDTPIIENFELFTNYALTDDTLVMEMDLSGGPFKGISLPSDTASENRRFFKYTFTIKNETSDNQRFFYKIYYQNSSYKHQEFHDGRYNRASANNFFGSWSGDSIPIVRWTPEIPTGEKLIIEDSIKIIGNPFNEVKYFGSDPLELKLGENEIETMIAYIKSNEEWYQFILNKAKERNMNPEDQLRFDAVYELRRKTADTLTNLRFRNNPRVGNYEFMLIAGKESRLKELPEYAINQKVPDPELGVRVNPFYWFKRDTVPEFLQVISSNRYLKTFAIIKPERGLYYDELDFPEKNDSGPGCSSDMGAYQYAHFKQFINNPELDSSLHNIDIALDVVGDSLSRKKYAELAKSSKRNIPSYVSQPQAPCRNAGSDLDGGAISVVNPGNTRRPYRKENGGVEGRFGFTYGKYKAKIAFPEILSSDGVWNGVTCAFWLKFFSLDDWNQRSPCKSGYVTNHPREDGVTRSPEDSYSEIDIEIVKAAPYWPPSSYKDSTDFTDHNRPLDKDQLIVACTNWDLACEDPTYPVIGATKFEHGDTSYVLHRWVHWYRAVTSKNPRPHAETVGQPFWYEIEWRPTEIIWRLGDNSNSLERICYMDSSVTTIPDNVMNPVISQEFHYGHWWPTTPYPQGDIPYPRDPVIGKVFEIRIE